MSSGLASIDLHIGQQVNKIFKRGLLIIRISRDKFWTIKDYITHFTYKKNLNVQFEAHYFFSRQYKKVLLNIFFRNIDKPKVKKSKPKADELAFNVYQQNQLYTTHGKVSMKKD